MYKIKWDKETGGVQLTNTVSNETLGISPRPVFFEELDLLGLDNLGWDYPRVEAPLLWAVNKQYYYRGELVFEAKGANIYDAPQVIFAAGKEHLTLQPVDVEQMLARNADFMFLLESEAVEFIRDIFVGYSSASKSVSSVQGNQVDFEALKSSIEKKTKTKMAIVKEDCDSFDIMPLATAEATGKRIYQGTKIDRFIASFSGGKDSQVILDLCTRAIPSTEFEVIYSDTGYELPPSLKLYEEVQEYYGKKFPNLKFTTARNHESVLNYWDKIGTPSDTHRWCCKVMKTAPLYRSLKIEGTNKQAKVLAFEGVRAEESTRRSGYNRIGRGVKHSTTINARPIFNWSTVEIFLYLFRNKLPLNPAYRQGLTRVGCVICPFASEWNEHLASKCYHSDIVPFVDRLKLYTVATGVKDVDNFIKQGNWKRRASGNLIASKTYVRFKVSNLKFEAVVENPKDNLLVWLHPLGQLSYGIVKDGYEGYIYYKNNAYPFTLEQTATKCTLVVIGSNDVSFLGLVRRCVYKGAYCIQCESCEVECPTGALSILPKPAINKELCIHCHKCLTFHDKGCIVASSLYQTTNFKMNAQSSIDRYKNFGLKEEWVDAYFSSVDDFWESDHGLNKTYQVPSLKNWLKDAEIIDAKSNLTELGKILEKIYQDNPTLVWEIIWINLCYNSFIANWFSARKLSDDEFSAKGIEDQLQDEFPAYKEKTIHNAVYQLFRTLRESPIGSELNQFIQIAKDSVVRNSYDDLSIEATAYSLYKYATEKEINFFRVSDLYNLEEEHGIAKEFCIPKACLMKKLNALSIDKNPVLTAQLNMGLDHITLRDDLTPNAALKLLVQ